MKRVRISTDRLLIRDLPPAAAGRVARFHTDNWHFHRPWEPLRHNLYFTERLQRRLLRQERRSDSIVHLWMLLDARGAGEAPRGGWHAATIIGSITLSSIVRGCFQSCFLGYKMDARYVRRGYMREALESVIDYAFGPLGLHRLEANVMPRNLASLGLLRSLGFEEEGLAREYLRIQGQWEDHLRMVRIDTAGRKNVVRS
ncbi:MAG: GNAT family N-acetyltransferase [Spirochaetota bacterium]